MNLTFADEGIDVITVGDGDTALERINEASPDLVLADVNMPGLSGYQICEKIRGNEATKNLPVVLLVGSFEPFDEKEADRVGANAYLTKPFQSIRQLVTQVSDLMASAPAAVEEETPKAAAPFTDDIDNLYNDSFADTSENLSVGSAGMDYGYAGMDDEIIETSYADTGRDDDLDFGIAPPVDDFDEESDYPSIRRAAEETDNASGETVIFDQAPQLEESVTEQRQEAFTETSDTTQPVSNADYRFDELDLLELPTAGKVTENRVHEQSSAPEDKPQVVTLSEEQMEMIVQRVVERLSAKSDSATG